MLSEISQTEKYKHCMISLICGIQKTEHINKQKNRNRLIDREQIGQQRGGNRGAQNRERDSKVEISH